MRVAEFLRQSDVKWLDIRHVQTLCWMIIGIIHSEQVHLSAWGIYTQSRTVYAQSHQRRFRRWLSNRRINLVRVYQALLKQTLGGWGEHRLYLRRGHNNGMELLLYCVVRGEIPAGGQFQ